MKNIDPKATTVKKVLCPFCSYGCDFGVVLDDFGIKGVEYMNKGSSEGRLCPRGSAAAMYMDHPRRLSMPLKQGKQVSWSKMGKEMRKVIGNPKSVAVTFDRNVTPEEYAKILGFCKKAGIENIASTYFEPDNCLKGFLDQPFSMSEVDNAERILILGDLFNYAPMSSKSIIEWKLKDKKHDLIVIDSLTTHTAGFADRFLKVNLGSEPLLLLALAQQKTDGIDVAQATGIDTSVIDAISGALKGTKNGILFVCLSFGHTYDPALVAEALRRLQKFSGMRIVPFVEFSAYDGTKGFAEVVEMIKKKKIKHVVNFGELFPFYYPQLASNLKPAHIYATSPIKYSDHNVLPVPLTIEKEGSVITTFGKKKLTAGVELPSGAKDIYSILEMLSDEQGVAKPIAAPEAKIDATKRAQGLAERVVSKKKGMRLIGEKISYNFLGFFEPETLKINPADAAEIGMTANDTATLTTKHGSADLMVKLTEDVGEGIVAVPAETPAVKGLFAYEVDPDTKNLNFIPTEVKICRKE